MSGLLPQKLKSNYLWHCFRGQAFGSVGGKLKYGTVSIFVVENDQYDTLVRNWKTYNTANLPQGGGF